MCDDCEKYRDERRPPPKLRPADDFTRPGRSLYRAQRHLLKTGKPKETK